MAWDDLSGSDVRATSSPVETARFGVSIGRVVVGRDVPGSGTVYDRAAESVAAALAEASDDILVVRYPAEAVGLGAVIAGSGRSIIPGGALTYWGADAEDTLNASPEMTDGHLDVVAASDLPGQREEVAAAVDDVIADSFAGYGSHYAANPLLDPVDALAGYQDWARRSLAAEGDTIVLRDAGAPIGVATCVASADGAAHLEVLLAGLVGAAQGRGWYALLLGGCATEARRRGLSRLIISTQVHNVRVQRAWARLGLRPFACVETVHAVRAGLALRARESGTVLRVARDRRPR
jgi:GNAT superfamily N-acetyltransferase